MCSSWIDPRALSTRTSATKLAFPIIQMFRSAQSTRIARISFNAAHRALKAEVVAASSFETMDGWMRKKFTLSTKRIQARNELYSDIESTLMP